MSIYHKNQDAGVIELSSSKAKKITFIAKDAKGNSSVLEFWIRRGEVIPSKKPLIYNYKVLHNEDNLIRKNDLKLFIPKNTLYENLYLHYQASEEQSSNVYSVVHKIQDHLIPAHKYFDISITPNTLPVNLIDKAFVAYCGEENKVVNYGGEWVAGQLKTKVRSFGDYCIMVDNEAPTIAPVSFSENMKGYNKMSFKIKDNFETAGNVRGLRFEATVDGKWILMEYDSKNDLLIHRFDNKINVGTHTLKLTVVDSKNNKTVFERKFVR